MPSNCPLITAAVYLHGNALNPTEISKRIGVAPTGSQNIRNASFCSPRFSARTGVWKCHVSTDSSPVSEILETLLVAFENVKVGLDSLPGVENARLDILFAFDEDRKAETLEFAFSKGQITKIHELGLDLTITVM